MLVFPNCKINIGLNIIEKRSDGFHNIQSVFYPFPLCDALEVVLDSSSEDISLHLSGNEVPGDKNDNIIVKAYHLIKSDYKLPGIKVHLHKIIPSGAGLGGGSSDAAFFIKVLNEVADLKMSISDMLHYASRLGSDCSFFIKNEPAFATQKGEVLDPISLSLKGYFLVLIKPTIFVSTAQAYAGVSPSIPKKSIYDSIQRPVEEWKDLIVNDFEYSVFKSHPALKEIKEELYQLGAVYASMSGSGSTIYGLFEKEVNVNSKFKDSFCWQKLLD